MPINIKCKTCGKTLKAKESAAGKKAKCPQCGGVIQVPQVVDAEDAEEAPEDDWGSDFGDIGQLAAMERSSRAAPEETRRPCPSCGEMIVAKAAKCRFCGEIFDTTLKRQEAKRRKLDTPSRSYSSDDDDTLNAGEWLLCILCSTIGCIVGIVYMCQGKSKGWKMIAIAFVVQAIIGVIRVVLEAQRPGGPQF